MLVFNRPQNPREGSLALLSLGPPLSDAQVWGKAQDFTFPTSSQVPLLLAGELTLRITALDNFSESF